MISTLFYLWFSLLFLFSFAVDIDMEGLPDTGLDTTDWVDGELPPLDDMWSLNDMQIAAKNVIAKRYYASYRTAALDEITYQANLNIWKNVRLNGYSFRDVSNIDVSTSILGYNFSLPFFIAPAANAGHANNSAELSLATAAGKAGILYVPSISSTKSLEEIANVALDDQVMFHQEYIWSNRSRLVDELQRIEAAGYKAIFLTVDNTGIDGIRTRSLRYTGESSESGHSATFDLASLAEIRNLTSLPIVPKGIKTAADAQTCLDLGFPAIYVSNHGGRTLDGAPTAVEILLDIRRNAPEVFERMEVYADGGVRRGNHVITLLALGARAVGLGRSPIFANIWGEEGVSRMIEMLQTEFETTMQLMGESKVANINSSYINTKLVESVYFGN
ncbi:FMN-dependent alpha-hydroxy acid dehydrogenase [Guyanagaster necrorhizus]|uniref:FMN-dependent alpha-hydroxy acid dehydrogenase n=1 Tax=Guyanagaster necrorhizus TaxID=856835 RepID=A0A9P8ARB6_9AGAR|nr:FMN-dependent alpha-hydroxy acid dehydrogenase [Guyanagaster necrorhizus MCA 3950]KAG7445024.1 FMN-dependent alpha-hydroxy acid dehydrogenase [Guyanagaster necrorhizus MCA 3950]